MSRGVLLAAAVVVLAACSQGSPSQPSSQSSPSTSDDGSSGQVGVATLPPTSPPAPSEPADSAALKAYLLAGNVVDPGPYTDTYGTEISFSTPSGNISCGYALGDVWVGCWIDQASWPALPTPVCEGGDWSDHWVFATPDAVHRGGCRGDQPWPMPGNVLPYGSTVTSGVVACRSESAFLACENLASGNGFALSKAAYHPYGTEVPWNG